MLSKRQTRILVLGLSGSCKRTFLHKIHAGEVITTIMTTFPHQFNVQTVESGKTTFVSFDVGVDDELIRQLWPHYYKQTDAVIFMVNCADVSRIDQVRDELNLLLNVSEMTSAALLVYAVKQNSSNSLSIQELTEKLNLHEVRGRKWTVMSCRFDKCKRRDKAEEGDGVIEGISWLRENT